MSTTATTAELTRTVDGHEVPAVGTYEIDASHSATEFSVRHLGLSKTRGRFTDFRGTVVIAEDPTESSVEVSIDAASIDTRAADRDGHLRSPDFLDTEAYPQLTFRSTSVAPSRRGWTVEGELTIKDVTQSVTLDVEVVGATTDPWGGQRIGFTATTEFDRYDFCLTWNQALEAGGLLVGKKISIDLDVEAVRS